MKLLVGLGNPGRSYEDTRHNIGFAAIDLLHGDNFSVWRLRDQAYIAKGNIHGEDVILAKPQTYMNASGDAVQPIAAFFKIAPHDILVMHDELDFPFGTVRLKIGGSSAGHNGIQSIIDRLGSDAFARIRIGIGTETRREQDTKDFVLERFSSEESAGMRDILLAAIAKAKDWVSGTNS